MKQLSAAIILLGAVFALTGCGTDEPVSAAPAATAATAATTAPAATPAVTGTAADGTAAENTAENTAAQTTAAQTTAGQTSAAEQTVPGTPAADLSGITGQWRYQVIDTATGGVYHSIGIVTVAPDGSYSYQPDDGSAGRNGTVRIDYDSFSDGSTVPFYAFYDTEFWIGCYCDQSEEDVFYIGNGGMSRLVRNTDTPPQSVPAEDDPAPDDTAVADIAGKWVEEGTGNILLVRQDDSFLYNDTVEGMVTVHYTMEPDGSYTVWFNFYVDDNILWNGFQRSDETPQNDLYSGQDGAVHFVRAE